MKIMLLIPIYKRPEVLRFILENFNLPEKGLKIELFFVFIISKEDKYFDTNLETVTNFLKSHDVGGIVVEYANLPVSDKQNMGIQAALSHDWEYLMNLGSDNILSNDYWRTFYPHLRNEADVVQMKNVVFYDCITDKYVEAVCNLVGAGRLIRRELVETTIEEIGYFYTPGFNSGMDTISMRNFTTANRYAKIKTIEGSYCLDIKTTTNINMYDEITRASQKTKSISEGEFERYCNLSSLRSELTKF